MRVLVSILTIVLTVSLISEAFAEPPRLPSLISALRVDSPLSFCGESVPLDIPEVRERFEKELLLTLWGRPQVILWLKRSARYLPIIEQELAEAQMPDDLKYIAIIESALRPHVGSSKGAIGFWQFMRETGRNYGLKINSRIDERRNIFRSTRAAIQYLKVLHDEFGSWTLAAAAYNMGEKGLMAEILAQQTSNYYQLYLPLETQRYVFRILCAKLILSNPEQYGFLLKPGDLYQPLHFDRVHLVVDREVPLLLVAKAAGTVFKVIKELNPEIRGHHLEKGAHDLLIPTGQSRGFQARFTERYDAWLSTEQQRIYVVKKGDNLSAIADRFSVPLPALLIWNRLNLKKPIHPGDRLIIYPPPDDSVRAAQN